MENQSLVERNPCGQQQTEWENHEHKAAALRVQAEQEANQPVQRAVITEDPAKTLHHKTKAKPEKHLEAWIPRL